MYGSTGDGMTAQNLDPGEDHAISDLIREAIARRRITRRYLADQAKISLSTLEKALSGQRPFTLASIVRLESALGVTLRNPTPQKAAEEARFAGIAPAELGSYGRAAVSWIEGDYLTVRPSFSTREAVYAYRMTIYWKEERSHLMFKESERIDAAFTQAGDVSIPHQSGHIYLVTNKHGQYRFAVVSRPTIAGEMFGILTTLQSGKGTHLLPVSTPLVLVPVQSLGEPAFGKIERGHSHFARYRALIERAVDEPFAMLIPR
jgi:transcriptional regulator with XRE-family HTH domain